MRTPDDLDALDQLCASLQMAAKALHTLADALEQTATIARNSRRITPPPESNVRHADFGTRPVPVLGRIS